jgi:Uncharacterized protein conserved in bacteria (DUF2188)
MSPRGRPDIIVEPRGDGWWARRKNGTTRAASLHTTQAEAERVARKQAQRERAELVVKGRDGTIQRREGYGEDSTKKPG